MLQPGTTLARGYTIDRVLGQGGMGTVYLARQTNLGSRSVALKEIHLQAPDARVHEQLIGLLRREAELLASLEHPGLVRVIDFFEEAGQHFFVMEFIQGASLQELCASGPLPITQALDWADQICEVLAWLHEHEPPVFVRDLKPSNVLVNRSGQLRIIDFGIATVHDAQGKTQTLLKGAGTQGYAPVEQFGSKGRTDARTDIYALGATLYTLVTGEVPPWSLDLVTGDAQLTTPRELNPRISEGLERVILKLMALKREDRFSSVREARAALLAVRQSDLMRVAAEPTSSSIVAPVAPPVDLPISPQSSAVSAGVSLASGESQSADPTPIQEPIPPTAEPFASPSPEPLLRATPRQARTGSGWGQQLSMAAVFLALFVGVGALARRNSMQPPVPSQRSSSPSASSVPGTSNSQPAQVSPTNPLAGQKRFALLKDSDAQRKQCREQLHAMGASLVGMATSGLSDEKIRLTIKGVAAKTPCPTTGFSYVLLEFGSRKTLYCSGWGHGPARMQWDNRGQEPLEDWPDLDAFEPAVQADILGTRYQASLYDQDYDPGVGLLDSLQQLAVYPGEWLSTQLALAQSLSGDPKTGLQTALKALEQHPSSASLLYAAGRCSLEAGDYTSARTYLESWRRAAPDDESIPELEVAILAQQQDWDNIKTLLPKLKDSLFRLTTQMALQQSAGLWDQARLVWKEQPNDPAATYAAVYALLGEALGGELTVSREHLQEALASYPKGWPYPTLLYLNGDLTEEQLFEACDDSAARSLSAKFVVALHLLVRNVEGVRARKFLEDVSRHPGFYEAPPAVRWFNNTRL